MELEIDMLSDNATSFEEEMSYERPLISYIYEYLEIVVTIIGALFNVVIIYIILRNKRMRTRTNIILLNWCVSDILFLFSELYLFSFLVYDQFENSAYIKVAACTIFGSEAVYLIVCTIFMIIMVTPSLIKRTTIKIAAILAITYTIASTVFLAHIITCSLDTFHGVLVITLLITLAYLFISVLVKDINRCRKTSGIPTSDKTLTRLNIAKIYVYNFMISIIFNLIINFAVPWDIRYHLRMLDFTKKFTGLYICIYLYITNKLFKICMLSLSKLNFTSSDVDATISFEEDSDVEDNENIKDNFAVTTPDVIRLL